MQSATIVTDIEVNGTRYQLGRMDPRTGSQVLAKLITCLSKMASSSENAEESETSTTEPEPEKLIQLLFMNLQDEAFTFVQDKALASVNCYRQVGEGLVTLPVMKNGNIAVPELSDDLDAVMQLTSQALFINLSPFFTKAGLARLFATKPASSL